MKGENDMFKSWSLSEFLFDRRKAIFMAVFLMVMFCLPFGALANDGGNLPWNTGLEKLINAFSGKTALLISMFGLFFAGGMLMFGGDLGTFGQRMMMVVLIGSLLGGLTSIVSNLVSAEGCLLI